MMDAGRHPKIEVLASSELKSVTGYIGNFTAVVRKKARMVSRACTSCGDCAEVCPVSVPDEFEEGLGTRHAIFKPFPQAIPSSFLIDPDSCLGSTPGAGGKGEEVCGGTAKARSLKTSTNTPPLPKRRTGPNWLSWLLPMISS